MCSFALSCRARVVEPMYTPLHISQVISYTTKHVVHFKYEMGQFRNLHSGDLIGGCASWSNVCGRGWMSRALIL